ncbi:STAS domain-containing protein [Streptomyces sp. SID7499]|uniref:Anti-sigma factor antagonist n=1 Tax=Streptomyces sp. SID7499 TaxID=2706086 RepID=A0A6G3WUG3_9ACTN|nr:STAS domain-containing protein [Streptomyces sp. SID7499]
MVVPVSGVVRSGDAGMWSVLVLSGEMDVEMAPLLRAAVAELVAQGRVHLVWDLAAVTFMDSACLGTLVYAMRSTEARQGRMRLAGAGTQVRRLLELTGLDTVLGTYKDLASATGPPPR